MRGDMWQELDGKHKGETGLIIGNGPSLKDVPIEFLHKYPTFGTNRIYLMDGFEPTYYASVNPLVVEQSVENINKLTSIKFIPYNLLFVKVTSQLLNYPSSETYPPSAHHNF